MNAIPNDIDFSEWAAFCGEQESQFVRPLSEFTQSVKDRFNGKGGKAGDPLPWNKTHNQISFRPGEVTLWAGINGHGKSQFLGQHALWSICDSRFLVASMEMKAEAQAERWLRQASGSCRPSEWFIDEWMTWTDGRLWIYDQLDTVAQDRIIGVVHYAAKELGVSQVVIDSLMKCGIPPDDYAGQKAFVDRLCWAAKTLNIHVHLVHHMRKRDKEGHKPDKFDVKGAGEIVDLVDNLIIVHRNKDKEEKIGRGEAVDPNEPDSTLTVAKQRHGEWEGTFKFWFEPKSQQYVPECGAGPMPWPSPETQWKYQKEHAA